MGNAKRDDNSIPTLIAVSNADGTTPVTLYADPTTHRLLVSATSGSLDDLSDVTLTSVAQGDILYHNGTAWVNLAAGTSGKFLKTQGAGANPTWDTPSAGAAGTDTQVQFNDGGTALGGDAGFTFNKTTNIATLTGGLTIYDATNDGNPEILIGSADAEELHIQSVYDTGAQTLDYVIFQTDVASATADKGEFRFNVDGALIATIDDGGIELADTKAYFIDTSEVLNETTLGSSVVVSSLTSVGTLTTLTVDDITINGNTISSSGASTLAITPTAGQVITFDGTVTLDAGVIAGATSITSTSFVGALTGNADTVTVANEATDTTCFIGFYTAVSGSLGGKTNTNLTFNSNTGVLTSASAVLTTADINGGTVDGSTIGASSASSIIGTTIDATTDFTIGGTVITNNTITDDGTLIINATTATSFSDGNITNVGDIGLDSLTADATNISLNSPMQLIENAPLILDAALSADGKYCGITESGTAGATLAFGDCVYLAAADSRWELTDSSAASTSGDVKIGICVLAAAADGDPTTILLWGKVRADTAFPAFTISAPVHISETAGDLVVAAPTTTDSVTRRVGFANTADELFFCPSNDYYTHT